MILLISSGDYLKTFDIDVESGTPKTRNSERSPLSIEKVYRTASYILLRKGEKIEVVSPFNIQVVRTLESVECVQASITDDIVIVKKKNG